MPTKILFEDLHIPRQTITHTLLQDHRRMWVITEQAIKWDGHHHHRHRRCNNNNLICCSSNNNIILQHSHPIRTGIKFLDSTVKNQQQVRGSQRSSQLLADGNLHQCGLKLHCHSSRTRSLSNRNRVEYPKMLPISPHKCLSNSRNTATITSNSNRVGNQFDNHHRSNNRKFFPQEIKLAREIYTVYGA